MADLNGDGKADLVVTNSSYGIAAVVLLGNGNGTFQSPLDVGSWTLPGTVDGGIVIRDVNGDGVPDLVSPGGVALGNGDGTFRLAQTFGGGYSSLVADLNSDGKPDVVVVGGNTVAVLLGNGDGTLQAAQTYAALPATWSVGLADINGDGIQDLIFSSWTANKIGVLLGNGNGTFQAMETFSALAGKVAVTDVNADGRPDVLIAGINTDSLGVLLNRILYR
jgi:hypothetical protein